MCIRKAGRNDAKGYLILLEGFMEPCGWVWEMFFGGIHWNNNLVQMADLR